MSTRWTTVIVASLAIISSACTGRRPAPAVSIPASSAAGVSSSSESSNSVAERVDAVFLDVRTGDVRRLPSELTAFAEASDYWRSPDGSSVVFQALDEGTHLPQLFVGNIDGTRVRPLTDEPHGAWAGRWSPDGTSIVFLSGLGESARLKMLDVDSGESIEVEGVPHGAWQPSFSADGRSFLISIATSNPRGAWRVDLWTVPTIGGTPTRLVQHGAYGAYSTDGSTIAYHRTAPQNDAFCGRCWWVEGGLVFADADGSEELGMARGGTVAPPEAFAMSVARWSPNGSMVLHTGPTTPGMPAEIVVRDLRSGETFRIGSGISPSWFDDHTLIVTDFHKE